MNIKITTHNKQMIKQVLATKKTEMKASTSQDKIQLLASLLNTEQISYKMLLRNIVEITRFDEGLTIQAVLVITDTRAIKNADIKPTEFEDALVSLRCSQDLRTAPVLIAAISTAMKSDW